LDTAPRDDPKVHNTNISMQPAACFCFPTTTDWAPHRGRSSCQAASWTKACVRPSEVDGLVSVAMAARGGNASVLIIVFHENVQLGIYERVQMFEFEVHTTYKYNGGPAVDPGFI